jgi:xanthine dehydrogenase accessory factor
MAAPDYIQALEAAIRAGRPVVLVTVVGAADRPELLGTHLVVEQGGPVAGDAPAAEELLAAAVRALAGGRGPSTLKCGDLRAYVEPFLPPPELVVVGAGHVAQPVAHLGKLLGFAVTVVDDRPDYASTARFPEADRVICAPFVAAVQRLAPGPNHYFVLVTRGHRYDMDCLRTLVTRPVAYIGMIGSRIRVETVFRLLEEEHGIDRSHFAKVYAPIGLDVGARTPAEVAVAVAAELLKVRQGGTGESLSRLGADRIHRR